MSLPTISSQVVSAQLEQVNQKLPLYLVARQSPFAKLFEKANPKHNISTWSAGTVGSGGVAAWRIPVEVYRGGDFGPVSLDAGDAGTGSMMATQFMTLPFYATDTAYFIPYQAQQATKTAQQAIVNVLTKSIGEAIDETGIYNEISLFQSGNGVLATGSGVGSPAGTNPTYNLESSQFGFIRFRGQNQLVDVWNSTLTTQKLAGGRISSIGQSFSNPTVSITGTVTGGAANTDVITFPYGANPPASLSNSSFRSGIYTYNTTNTSGSLNGLAYSTVYELATCQINGGGGLITPTMVFAGKEIMYQRRDEDALNGLVGVCHTAQRASWYFLGITVANQFVRPGESLKSIDMAGQGTKQSDTFEIADIKHYCSRYADRSRIDWLVPKNFGRVQLAPLQFLSNPDGGQRVFEARNPATGNVAFAWQFYVVNTENLYSVDPGAALVIYNLAQLSGM